MKNEDRKFVYYVEQEYNGVGWRSRPYSTAAPAKRQVAKYKKQHPSLADTIEVVEYELTPTGREF
jgi:hypothetical protein